MKKPWRYERRNIFLPFPRNLAITMIISTVSNLDNFSRAWRISDNWLKPSLHTRFSYRTELPSLHDPAWCTLCQNAFQILLDEKTIKARWLGRILL
jgi:hypothetical protein